MTTAILAIIGGLIALAIGGELLVRGAVALARRLGISNLLTGLVIVGAATSMPEMVASVQAALIGSPEIAWGNIAGSNIANSLLILGATALIAPIAITGIGKRDAAVAVGASALMWVLAWWQTGTIWLGVALLALLGLYIAWRYSHPRVLADEDVGEGGDLGLGPALALTLGGVGVLVLGGTWLVGGAIDIARMAGISETVIGLTIVAVGTSLPELAASAAAAFRGKPGLAIGNVVGSNIYNILLIGGATMLLAPFPIPAELALVQIPLVIGSAVLIWALLAYGQRIGRITGALLLAGFAANTALQFL
ncbi:calcium/sodium antiporter [Erythrobacter litoralis]|uniref:K+-dependent Na+/Ca+ exchanger related-protein n=1 Tax=Erythrobacter litoralis (strain HTCC2594) TaxID=314225 RepID=Q2NCP1_ERYLH|nr:calcium/sodium antiporter [Erythrobacter litoralis]ABC62550.1 K+-dependent Na+/Ca+ exchanger related-protein [Erythrobacter litoralis HTCC2594]